MKECLADHHVLSQRILSIRVTHHVSPYPHWYVFTIQHLHRQPGPWPPSRVGILPCRFGSPFVPVGAGVGLSRVGILPCRFGSPFVPVGAGEGLCGVGTLASPSSCSRERLFPLARATQASPLHPTPLPPLRIRFILSPKC